MDSVLLFCDVDDFCKAFEPQWRQGQLELGERRRRRGSRLATSEIMTIVIAFHASDFRTFSLLVHRFPPPSYVFWWCPNRRTMMHEHGHRNECCGQCGYSLPFDHFAGHRSATMARRANARV